MCIDFDEENFRDDVKAFLTVCEKNGIPAATEISRSGNGAHIWIFFKNATQARTARSLGTALLTSAMELNSRLSFRSYDRMFPNQDTMPNGGFGNLVALPLQGKARKNGNSLFVDNDFLSFSDQWAYLSLVKKYHRSKLRIVYIGCVKTGSLEVLPAIRKKNHGNQQSILHFKNWISPTNWKS